MSAAADPVRAALVELVELLHENGVPFALGPAFFRARDALAAPLDNSDWDQQLLSQNEVAARLGVSRQRMYQLTSKDPELAGLSRPVGSLRVWRAVDIEAYASKRKPPKKSSAAQIKQLRIWLAAALSDEAVRWTPAEVERIRKEAGL